MGEFDLSEVPTGELKVELANRPDYCWYQGDEIRVNDRTGYRLYHLCHCSEERSAHCEMNGGIGRCMTCIRAWNKRLAAQGSSG